MIDLRMGDCLEIMGEIPDNSVDSVVTDPPAGIAFMLKSFDTFRSRLNFISFLTPRLAECLRIARPGSRMLCWAIPRTSHWTGTAIEDAGWIIEDKISHIFGQGFPKAKSKLKPAVEEWWLARKPSKGVPPLPGLDGCRVATAEALRGSTVQNDMRGGNFGNGHTPNLEDIAAYEQHRSGRWPANLVLSHHSDCNGVCVEGCPVRLMGEQGGERTSGGFPATRSDLGYHGGASGTQGESGPRSMGTAARFFPNFAPDDEPEPFFHAQCDLCGLLSGLSNGMISQEYNSCEGNRCSRSTAISAGSNSSASHQIIASTVPRSADTTQLERIAQNAKCAASLCDSCAIAIARSLVAISRDPSQEQLHGWGSMSESRKRILFLSLATLAESLESIGTIPTIASLKLWFGSVRHAISESITRERNDMSDGFDLTNRPTLIDQVAPLFYCPKASRSDRGPDNAHPTVKPQALMRWLCRLITPQDGTVADPFMGSGSTGKAAMVEGFGFFGIESDPGYFEIASKRLNEARAATPLFA